MACSKTRTRSWPTCCLALMVVHLVAALRHHFIKHDTVLRRMWFGS